MAAPSLVLAPVKLTVSLCHTRVVPLTVPPGTPASSTITVAWSECEAPELSVTVSSNTQGCSSGSPLTVSVAPDAPDSATGGPDTWLHW